MPRTARSGSVIRGERSDDLRRPPVDVGPVTVIAVTTARREEEEPSERVPVRPFDHARKESVRSTRRGNVGRQLPGAPSQSGDPGSQKARRLAHRADTEEPQPQPPPRIATDLRQQLGRGGQPPTVVDRAPEHDCVVRKDLPDIVSRANIHTHTSRGQLACDCLRDTLRRAMGSRVRNKDTHDRSMCVVAAPVDRQRTDRTIEPARPSEVVRPRSPRSARHPVVI